MYIRSEDAAASNGVGYVQTLAIAAAFGALLLHGGRDKRMQAEPRLARGCIAIPNALLASVRCSLQSISKSPLLPCIVVSWLTATYPCPDKGQLQSLQWSDLTCSSCGGVTSKQCMTSTTSQPQHSCAGELQRSNPLCIRCVSCSGNTFMNAIQAGPGGLRPSATETQLQQVLEVLEACDVRGCKARSLI